MQVTKKELKKTAEAICADYGFCPHVPGCASFDECVEVTLNELLNEIPETKGKRTYAVH